MLVTVGALAQMIRGDLGRRRALGGALIVAFALASLRVLGAKHDTGANQVAIAHGISLGIGLVGLGLVLFQFGRGWIAGELQGWWKWPADWLDRFSLGRSEGGGTTGVGDPTNRMFLSLHVLGALTALTVQHLHLFMLALVVSIVAGEFFERRVRGTVQPPIMLVATMVAIGAAWYFLAHVAGEQPLGLAALAEAPFSAAFELGASLVLCLVAYRLLGLWPVHGARQGLAAPLLGGILLARLVLPVLPNGLEHWQPFLYLLVATATWHAALTRRLGEALTSILGLGLLSGDSTAAWSGLSLAAGMAAPRLLHRLGLAHRIPDAAGWLVFQVAGLIGLLLLLPTLSGGLAVEVFYSAVAVCCAVALLWRVDPRHPPGHICDSSVRDSSG